MQDLAKIQKFLALRDDQIEKTKMEVNRLRTLTEIRRGNLPVVPPSHIALRGIPLESGEVPHYSLAVEIMDQPRFDAEGIMVKGVFVYKEGSASTHFLPENDAKPQGDGNLIITNKRIVLKTAEGRTASVTLGGRRAVLPLRRGHPPAEAPWAATLPQVQVEVGRHRGDRGRAPREAHRARKLTDCRPWAGR